jgi:hypothetical protein
VPACGVYRDEQGVLHERSALCSHLGCFVTWNNSEKTWDCPCHGSSYDRYGRVIEGPAKKDLANEKLDWRGYVQEAPYLSIGAAAAVGLIASGMLKRKPSAIELFMDSIEGRARRSLKGLVADATQPSLLRKTVLSISWRLSQPGFRPRYRRRRSAPAAHPCHARRSVLS